MYPKGSRKMRGTINAAEVIALKKALASAKLEWCAVNKQVQDEMKPFLDSWVVAPLQYVLDGIEKRFNLSVKMNRADSAENHARDPKGQSQTQQSPVPAGSRRVSPRHEGR